MLVVLGSYNHDLVWRTAQFPKAGETCTGLFSQGPGGKGFNQAMAAHRQACNTVFIAAIGDDALGQQAQQLAQQHGLACAWQICPNTATGNAAIWLDATGQNQIVVDLAANHCLSIVHVAQQKHLTQAKVLLVQQETNVESSAWAMRAAKAAGAICMLNPAPAFTEAMQLLQLADIITPNESEFVRIAQQHQFRITNEALTQMPAEDLHQLAQKISPITVIITLGARGVLLSTPQGFTAIPAPRVQVRDTTGAGDCFNGVLAAELANGRDLLAACQFAVLAAALKVECIGAGLAMPSRADVQVRFTI